MNPNITLWTRLPVMLRAIIGGALVLFFGSLPWGVLAGLNVTHYPRYPWSAVVMCLYLWLFWRYLDGGGWPRRTAQARKENLRARALAPRMWVLSLLAGALGVASLVFLLLVARRLVTLPNEKFPDVSQIPVLTVLAMILMGAAVAGIVEESAIRGYMQGPIERKHGPSLAIAITGVLFGLAHLSHGASIIVLLPYYVAVSVVYGTLAYLTGSILPSLLLHAAGDAVAAIVAWLRSPVPAPKPLIWHAGLDATFLMNCAMLIVFVLAAVLAYRRLARMQLPRQTPSRA